MGVETISIVKIAQRILFSLKGRGFAEFSRIMRHKYCATKSGVGVDFKVRLSARVPEVAVCVIPRTA